MSAHTTTGPGASERDYQPDDVRLRVADLVGAYHHQEYHAMHTHALALVAIARRLGATRNVDPVDIEDVPSVASEVVAAYQDGDADEMSALALGLLDVATTHKGGGA